jgi:O-glycosyl hydrolase
VPPVRWAAVVGMLVGLLLLPGAAEALPSTRIAVDGHAYGRRFDGVGAISGGGGNARYLIDYPRRQRAEILDSLFKPGYGAGLQILKVEIGGDGDSTDGAEASIEHTAGRVDCDAGYEWWLMEQAKRRNPHLKLYALAWGAPGWLGSFFSRPTIDYMLAWLGCARRHGLHIDVLGGTQNEGRRGRVQYDAAWTVALHAAMRRAGFGSTRIAMSDAFDPHANWAIARGLARDRALRRATSLVAVHDVCGYPTKGFGCSSTRTARRLGLPLWTSELGGIEGDEGAVPLARALIRGYSTARLVGYLTWPIVSAMPSGLRDRDDGLVLADQPWSGHYRVRAISYAIAALSWFTSPGWRYVDGANGRLRGGGAYTTLRSPRRRSWTTVAETTSATRRTRARFRIRGRLPARRVHVWRSDLSSRRFHDWMVRRRDVRPRHGRFSYVLRRGYVYSFTTVAHGRKRSAGRPPRARGFRGYVTRPGANPLSEEPAQLAAMDGAFAYRRCWDDPKRTCIAQLAAQRPLFWHPHAGFPHAVVGDEALRDYTVSADVRFRDPGSSAGVIARFSDRGAHVSNFRGFILDLDDGGRWQLLRNARKGGVTTLASGAVAPPGVQSWHAVALRVRGSRLTALIDGRTVAALDRQPRAYARGIGGIEAGAATAGNRFTGTEWPVVEYRRLTVAPA